MADRPTSSDREQQHADNVESRRQSGLEPMPKDRERDGDSRDDQESESGRGERRREDTEE